MRTTPIYGWPMAEGTDARRDFPLAVDQPRTQAIETALDDATRRVQQMSNRAGDAESGIDTAVPLTGPITIPDAPAGMYLLTAECDYELNGPGSPVHWTAVAPGMGLVGWQGMFEVDDNYRHRFTLARAFPHTGGALQVLSVSLRASLANVRIFGGAVVTVTRISA